MDNRKSEWEALKKEYKQPEMTQEQIQKMKDSIAKAQEESRRNGQILVLRRGIMAAAAAVALFIILPNTSASVAYAMSGIPVVGKLVEAVTFRNYRYESDRHMADVEVPELVVKEDGSMMSQTTPVAGEQNTQTAAGTQAGQDAQKTETIQKTTEEINREIQEITDQIIGEFEENLKYEEGYQDVMVKSEVINTTEQYFTLKLICYQGAGSGAEWDYFYTIDLNSGERLKLKDLFEDGADYITPISDDIKKQMREQMDADENVHYWLDDEDIPEWNFREITEDTSFYINGDDQVVIAFNEGDVAPMYMGCVEFVIDNTVLTGIRK